MDFRIKDLLRGKRLILVSNREPYIHERVHGELTCVRARGGLVSALDPVMRACEGIWIAWGSTAEGFEAGARIRVPPEQPRYTLKRVKLSEEEVDLFYGGFSNRTLWPLFHGFTERARFDPTHWQGYRKVNAKFASAVLEEMKPGDWIWIHDYHLSLVPRFIRERAKRARVSLFWHVPWVPWEIFRNLPWRREILEGMLGADLLGFQTRSYAKNFIECFRAEFGIPSRMKGVVDFEGRKVRIGEFPIGIDYDHYARPPKAAIERADRISRIYGGKHILLSIDRLDYTKGVLKRLEAFERFLEKYPHFHGDVVFVSVTTPSRWRVAEYRRMKEEIDRCVGRINSRFRRMDWSPIHYFYRTLTQTELLSLYRASDVALITPLMDGMNLISKEYVATSENGVLILSEFAGAAEELKEALLVNPHDKERVAGAIKTALKMSPAERRRRSRALKRRVKRFDVRWWLRKYFKEWQRRYG